LKHRRHSVLHGDLGNVFLFEKERGGRNCDE